MILVRTFDDLESACRFCGCEIPTGGEGRLPAYLHFNIRIDGDSIFTHFEMSQSTDRPLISWDARTKMGELS